MEADVTTLAILLFIVMLNVIGAIGVYFVQKRIKDAQLRDVLANAVRNSVGIGGQVGTILISRAKPKIDLDFVPEFLQPKVAYVIEHADDAIKRFGITPEKIAEKVVAQIGIAAIQSPTITVTPQNVDEAERKITARLNKEQV